MGSADLVPVGSADIVSSEELTETEALTNYLRKAAGAAAQTVNPNVYFKGGPHFDVKAFGAVGDGGTTADEAKIIQAITAARDAGGGTVFVPPGVYLSDNTHGLDWPVGIGGVRLLGVKGKSIIKRAGGSQQRVLRIQSGTDLTIESMSFDVNNIDKFGGLNIAGVNRLLVRDCRFFDSNLHADWATFDHYSLVIQNSTGIWVIENVAEDVELLEANFNDRTYCLFNECHRAAGTTAIGHFTVGNGTYMRDFIALGNIIVDPRKGAIVVQHEAGGQSNNEWRRHRVVRNHVIRNAGSNIGAAAFRLGNFTGDTTGTGNIYDDLAWEDNTSWWDSSLVPTTQEFQIFQPTASTQRIEVRTKGNRVRMPSGTAYRVNGITESEISENEAIMPGGGLGMEIGAAVSKTRFGENKMKMTGGTGFQYAATEGDNIFEDTNRVIGTPAATLSLLGGAASDKILPGIQPVRKSAVQQITNSTTLVDVADLGFDVVPGTYHWEARLLMFSDNAVMDAKFGWLTTGLTIAGLGAGSGWGADGTPDALGGFNARSTGNTPNAPIAYGSTLSVGSIGANHFAVKLSGTVKITAGTGRMQLQVAQNTLDAGILNVYEGSWLRYQRA